jgi:uncharacterized protein YndB with AHSA1/START domain
MSTEDLVNSEGVPEPVIVDCDLDAPPEKVWRALTQPELMAAWLAEGDIRPQVGHRFELKSEIGPVECEVLTADPKRELRLSWRERDEAGDLVDSEVTFVLTPTVNGGTRLRLVHDGFAHAGFLVMAIGRIVPRKPVRRLEWVYAWAA